MALAANFDRHGDACAALTFGAAKTTGAAVSIMVVPQKWMVFMETPIKMDDLGASPPFQETSIFQSLDD